MSFGPQIQKLSILPRFLLILTLMTAASCGSSDNSSSSAVGTAAVVVSPPVAPTGLSASPEDGYNQLSWSAATGATSYNIYWATSSGVNPATANKFSVRSVSAPHGGIVNSHTYYYVVSAQNAGGESSVSSEISATPVNGAGAADPLLVNQWHIKNTTVEDIDVEPVWAACGAANSCRGEGVRIAIVDNGVEIAHEDLFANVASGSSYNYVDGSNDPTSGDHGTCVAGLIAARDLNGLGGSGVAPRANIVGYNMLQNSTTSNMADSMVHGLSTDSVSSNSWGYEDGLGQLSAPPFAWISAITTGITSGRNGLGTNYVFAAGNGDNGSSECPSCQDNANYDGLASNRGVIAVGAVRKDGTKTSYSEQGANLWVSAPGGEFCNSGVLQAITTTDRAGSNGFNPSLYPSFDYANQSYTKCMNGTSAATPQVAGVIALMLQSNPLLTWRDVRLILAKTARKNSVGDSDWVNNQATSPYHVNHKFGFGVVDAAAAVTAAASWTNVTSQVTFSSVTHSPNSAIPDNNSTGVSDTIAISSSGITKIEWIEITFSAADHPYSGDLQVTLTNNTTGSPTTSSVLSNYHVCANSSCVAYSGWVFGTARHLGESADGNWTLTVKDGRAGNTGHFQSWHMTIYGT